LPTVSDDVVKVATPAPSSEPVPSVLPKSLKVTAPVGMPDPGALACKVAVKVTVVPTTEGFTLDRMPVVVPSGFTTWGAAESSSELARKLLSPP
jgi:hypothetical protein